MRRNLVVAAVAGAVVFATLPAHANHRPQNYCSESGDVCQSTKRIDGVRKLRITLAAKYFDRYKLCVKAPDDSTTCKRFRIRKQGDVYGSTVRWRKHFPNEGEGAYTVTWRNGGSRIGARLGFHVR
ncbi:MAG: hypothetical protein M3271_09960 [Actinomycetota bacterium]|nr:hypothetical protein [Actinomycetota bacterium]